MEMIRVEGDISSTGSEIIVIDDDTGVRELFHDVIGPEHHVKSFDNMADGVAEISPSTRLVFLDYKFPRGNGIEALKSIRRNNSDLPVIFMTAFGDEDVCRDAFISGAHDYIRKPFPLAVLRQKVNDLVSCGGNKREYAFDNSGELQKEPYCMPSNQATIYLNIMKVRRHIEEHYAEQLSLFQAARMACLNRSHFCSYFRSVTGCSFIEYTNRIRIKKAEDLLRNREMSITEIALAIGYNSVNYFDEIFKQMKGYSPRKFRERYQRAENITDVDGEGTHKMISRL